MKIVKELSDPSGTVIEAKTKVEFVCSDCKYFKLDPMNMNRGFCHGNPPIAIGTPQGPGFIRPLVNLTDKACRFYDE